MFVPVPNQTNINECYCDDTCLYLGNLPINISSHFIRIEKGNWQLLGDSKQLTEEDLVGVMPKVMGQHYINHNSKSIIDRWCKTALEAFNSLKESLQLSDSKHIVLFEAKK